MRILTIIAGIGFMALSVSCEGPMGPEGPAGPVGDAGPGTRTFFSGQFDTAGQAEVALPSEAGNFADPPVIGVYISPDGFVWAPVSVDFVWDGEWIVSSWVAVREEGDSLVVFITGLGGTYANWYYRIVVIT